MIWWTDGSGWNGRSAGWLVCNESGLIERRTFAEEKTNNEMEYEAVIYALLNAQIRDEIRSDSQLVVNQVLGIWKCKEPRLFPLLMQAKAAKAESKADLKWIPREENRAGMLIEGGK